VDRSLGKKKGVKIDRMSSDSAMLSSLSPTSSTRENIPHTLSSHLSPHPRDDDNDDVLIDSPAPIPSPAEAQSGNSREQGNPQTIQRTDSVGSEHNKRRLKLNSNGMRCMAEPVNSVIR
jgi:hypothetical protein